VFSTLATISTTVVCMVGADVDFTDSHARSALYIACLNEFDGLVNLLLLFKANPNQFVTLCSLWYMYST